MDSGLRKYEDDHRPKKGAVSWIGVQYLDGEAVERSGASERRRDRYD
jgi:hypothetical protein